MGRGLEAILSVSAQPEQQDELRRLPVDMINPNPAQPRGRFDDESLAALAASFAERGVLQPVLVRGRPGGTYELIAGERRWRAARLAGLDEIPAIVRQDDDAAALELALIENMAREDLNPVDQARACAALVDELGLTREDVGRRVGRSRVAVSNLMRLLELPDETLELIEAGALSEGHGRALLLAEDHAVRRSLARAAATEGWSVRVTEDRARAGNAATAAGSAPRRPKAAAHPDQEHASREIAEALAGALGADVRVRAARGGGVRAEISFASPAEALELARRLAGRKTAR
jgi:ParB family chromosome partitioning protein